MSAEPAIATEAAPAAAVNPDLRRAAAAAIALTLVALVVCDVELGGVRDWWDRHSLTGSILASLLVVGATALIFDEAIARHQRRERATTVAVQGMILYAQAQTTLAAVLARDEQAPASGGAREQMRGLAGLLLAASPGLFDDPTARVFLVRLQRLMGAMLQTIGASPQGPASADPAALLVAEMAQLRAAMEPLRARLPVAYRSMFEDQS